MAKPKLDKELEMYRNLLDTPTESRHGFGWNTVAGILFCGLVMLPGSIYLSLMTGGNLGAAGTWVTVILFAEIAKRAMKAMVKQELVVLLYAAGIMIGGTGPFGGLVFRAYLVTSDAVRDAGMTGAFPSWFAPKPDSFAITHRDFFHHDWLMPVALIAAMTVIGLVSRFTLGYFFFRLTSDVENLPFPMAPISAQGALAMAEEDEPAEPATAPVAAAGDAAASGEVQVTKVKPKKKSLKWRIFSLGVTFGILFGAIQVGIPAVSGVFLEKSFFLIPQPWVELTTHTEGFLPATPTGMIFDLGIIMVGFVLPFYIVIGSLCAIVLTLFINPLLHHFGILTHWQPGMDTINTTFANNIDFWMSFGIGSGLGIAAVSIYSTIRDVRAKLKETAAARRAGATRRDLWAVPRAGRGDYPIWIAIALYCAVVTVQVILCHQMVPNFPIAFLLIFSFIYNPFISYVNARLLGISGQSVDIPFIKETAFILSGAKGVEIWLAPIPIENYGGMAQSFRVNELTGVNFFSLIRTEVVAQPVIFVLSLLFWAFIWKAQAIPSDAFPYAQKTWDLQAKNAVLLYSSTFAPPGEDPSKVRLQDSQFMKAIHPKVIGAGFTFSVFTFVVLNAFGLPVMILYGLIRGLGNLPHFMVLEIVGALIGRYYFQKKYGQTNFLKNAPILLAGYFTGVGLISMATIALRLIQGAVSSAPF